MYLFRGILSRLVQDSLLEAGDLLGGNGHVWTLELEAIKTCLELHWLRKHRTRGLTTIKSLENKQGCSYLGVSTITAV